METRHCFQVIACHFRNLREERDMENVRTALRLMFILEIYQCFDKF
jgi:hypothetical protein